MLIFVQMCRTIDKNLNVFKSSIGSGRTKEGNGIYKEETCVARKHLKKWGSEDHQKLTSSEALSSEVVYQKLTSSEVLKIIRSWRSSEAERLKATKLLYVVIITSIIAKGIEGWSNDYLRGIWRHWMLNFWRKQKKDNITNCTTTTSTTPLPLSAAVLFNSCDYTGISLSKERIWNCSLIGQ